MTRTEIIDTAKQLVLAHGPSNALEFTTELVEKWDVEEGPDFDAVYAETRKQARRVYDFLGYVPR